MTREVGVRSRVLATWGFALLPAASIATFYLYVLRARVALGAWPQLYRPDPKDLGFDLHYALVLASLALAATSPVGVAVSAQAWRRSRSGLAWPALSVSVAGWAALLWIVRADPGRFVDWFLD